MWRCDGGANDWLDFPRVWVILCEPRSLLRLFLNATPASITWPFAERRDGVMSRRIGHFCLFTVNKWTDQKGRGFLHRVSIYTRTCGRSPLFTTYLTYRVLC